MHLDLGRLAFLFPKNYSGRYVSYMKDILHSVCRMSVSDHPKYYGAAAAFTAGVFLTLGFKDLYPDLEASYQQRHRPIPRTGTSTAASDSRRRSSIFWGPVNLEDHEGLDTEEALADSATLETTHNPPAAVSGIEGSIGNTPLIELRSLSAATGCTILAKAEFLNGAGNSPKDRVALSMIRSAEAAGLLVPGRGDTIYEGTVGSTGISLATLARAMGYRAHICMPDDQAHEKSDLLRHLGATVERVRVAPITSPDHFVNLARRRARDHTASSTNGSRGYFADQFENPANWQAHYETTGPEIHAQVRDRGDGRSGHLDAFVAGAGTGGTIAGVARYLKSPAAAADFPSLRVVLADPQGSGLYHKVKHGVMYSPTEKEGTRRRQQVDSIVEGVGVNRITENFEAGRDLVDDAVKVSDEQAMLMARWLSAKDGVFAGSSTAVNCVAAVAAALQLPPGSVVATVLCDSGTRHLSKFWKKIGELGLEEKDDEEDLLAVLGLQKRTR